MKRWLLIGGGALLIAVLAIGLYVYVQLDSLVKRAIEGYGGDILQVKVSVDSVHIAPGSGEGLVTGLRIGPPKGFGSDVANVGKIDLAVDIGTVTEDVVHVRRIVVAAPQITYEQSPSGTNLAALQRNVAASIGETSPDERKSETKLIVDKLSITGIKVTYVPLSGVSNSAVTMNLPDIVLSNLGKARGGITGGELTKIVVDTLLSRTAAAVGQAAMEQGKKGLLDRLFGK